MADNLQERYPWFDVVNGLDIKQGDILEGCPVFVPPSDLASLEGGSPVFGTKRQDVIVMSQSCDLALEHPKLDEVLVCNVWKRSELLDVAQTGRMENARKGNLPGIHVLAPCTCDGFAREVRVVDFRRLHSLPLAFLRTFAAASGARIRLLPPYREHLSQAFARFFMRVGLPVDIPPFK